MTSQASPAAPTARQEPRLLLLAAAAMLSLWAHWISWPVRTPDIDNFLLPWYDHILRHGPIGAFAQPFSNYTPPYLYLLAAASLTYPTVDPFTAIKLLSVAGSGFLALAVAVLLRAAGADRPMLGGAAVLLVPTVILNAAFLGQCDALWVGASLLAVAGAIRGRMIAMLVWAGVAVSFKAQAAFIAPFVFAVLLQNRVRIHCWLIPPVVYAAMMMPAWLAGWPALDLLMVYPRQTGELPGFISNAANLWAVGREFAADASQSWFALGYAAALAAAGAFVWAMRGRLTGPNPMLLAATLSALMVPWLLPKMHERYFMLADLLAVCLALTVRERPAVLVAVLIQFASLSAIFSYTVNRTLPVMLGSLIAGGALIQLIDLLRRQSSARPVTRPTPSPDHGPSSSGCTASAR